MHHILGASLACTFFCLEVRAACNADDGKGVRIPLGVHPFVDDPGDPDADDSNPPAMSIDVSPITSAGEVLPPQRVLFDTGSAGLAFCNSSFSTLVQDALVPGLVPCKSYGGPGNWVAGYWGKVYKGGLDFAGVQQLDDASYGIMQQDIGMPCRIKGFMGIFGAAFRPNYKLFETTADISDDLWEPGKVDNCSASIPNMTGQTTVTPPLEQLSTELADGGTSRIGIYWDGSVGASAGMLYLDDAATANPHYSSECALRARSVQGQAGHYNIFIRSMTAGGKTFTGFPCTQDLQTYCILDTGSSTTTLPQEVVDALGDGSGSLEIELEGPPGQPAAKLTFDLAALGRVQETPIDGVPVPVNESFVMLGLPTWAFYYTVFSSDNVTEFIPHECCKIPDESMPESVSDAETVALDSGNFDDLLGENLLGESSLSTGQSVRGLQWPTSIAVVMGLAGLVAAGRAWYLTSNGVTERIEE